MADKPTITTLSAGQIYDTTTLNTIFTTLRDHFENVLGTNGTSGTDNQMTGDLDMNNKTLRNVVFELDSGDYTLSSSAIANQYTFSSTTTMAAPGTGTLRLNNATLASVTQIAIQATSAESGNPDISDYIATWDNSSNSNKGYIRFSKLGTPGTFLIVYVSGSLTDNTTWLQIPVTYVASNGSFSDGDSLLVSFTAVGDAGANGAGTGDVLGQASSVDSEIALFSGTTGKVMKRATGTGYAKVSSGVLQTPAATIPLTDLASQAANTVLVEKTGSSAPPTALAMGASTILARLATGNIVAATVSEINTLLGSSASFKVGSITRDLSTASGSVATTGIGFQPKAVIFLGTQTSSKKMSIGFTDGTNQAVIYQTSTAGTFDQAGTCFVVADETTGSASQIGALGSLDADGFTIVWTKVGSPTGTFTVRYLALK